MTDEKLGMILESFTNYYWSIPVALVVDRIAQWHPEVTAKQFERVLNRCNEDLFWRHCCTIEDGLEEPELVSEHLIAINDEDFDRFCAARFDGPYCDCEEESLLNYEEDVMKLPEARAIMDFGRAEFDLDEEWETQLIKDCMLSQPYALCDEKSWVMSVLRSEGYGKIHFRTLRQVRRFRELGNRLYLALPNPVFKGWKPTEIANAPVLLDDIPAWADEIPDERAKANRLRAPLSNLLKSGPAPVQHSAQVNPKRKIGRNEPCPCGSGKKYKKCCGRKQMNG
jgi:hypothetical protein